jgi:SAM-dependent methyltransferase
MAAQLPRVETDVDAIWTPALARGLIRDNLLGSMRYREGYTDLLGPTAPTHPYESIWRLAARCRHRRCGVAEYEKATAAVHLGGEQQVLDVVCGPGDFTRFVAGRLGGDGFVIGVDGSVPMMERAARDNSHARAVYLRSDALSLPFNDGAFDVVCCFAGLHLVHEPIGVLCEMVRVLSPGGRIAVMTSYGRESSLLRKGLEIGAVICGVRVFDHTTVTAFLAAAGLTDIDQRPRGKSQFVSARRPEKVPERDVWRTRSASRPRRTK